MTTLMRIIITGPNSFVSNRLKEWIEKNFDWKVLTLSLRDEQWAQFSFLPGDCIVHCAGLVHAKANEYTASQYNEINTILTLELAKKAKRDGAAKFIFMSSRAVYGIEGSCFRTVVIDENTVPKPKSDYGISKYNAELGLQNLSDKQFGIVVVRAPFIYGNGCKGNYTVLRKLVLKIGIIPKLKNEYSMMHINNLCQLIVKVIEKDYVGLVTPQDTPIRSTYEMALLIAKHNGKKVWCTNVFNPIIRLLSIWVKPLRTAFGSEIYDTKISKLDGIDYTVIGFEDSIAEAERK